MRRRFTIDIRSLRTLPVDSSLQSPHLKIWSSGAVLCCFKPHHRHDGSRSQSWKMSFYSQRIGIARETIACDYARSPNSSRQFHGSEDLLHLRAEVTRELGRFNLEVADLRHLPWDLASVLAQLDMMTVLAGCATQGMLMMYTGSYKGV
jgi:hypothetical protein